MSGRIRTGIPDLDEMLRGGFMEGDAVMLAGSAGTGKTTLALQYLVNGVRDFEQKGLYVSFEQLPEQIYRDANSFGWDLRAMENTNRLRVICTSPNLLLEDGGEHLLDTPIREIKPHRIVIDSLSHLGMYVSASELRRETYRLIMYLKTRGLSSLLTWEASQAVGVPPPVSDIGVSFLVDCMILLRFVEIDSSMRKALAVLKMRGSDHDKRLREFSVTPAGIKLAEPFIGYEGILTGSTRKTVTEAAVRAWGEAFGGKR